MAAINSFGDNRIACPLVFRQATLCTGHPLTGRLGAGVRNGPHSNAASGRGRGGAASPPSSPPPRAPAGRCPGLPLGGAGDRQPRVPGPRGGAAALPREGPGLVGFPAKAGGGSPANPLPPKNPQGPGRGPNDPRGEMQQKVAPVTWHPFLGHSSQCRWK